MKNEEFLFSTIDDFLNGNLDDAQMKEFEAELAKDVLLKEKVEDSELANLALKRKKLWDVKNLTEEIDREEKQLNKTKKIVVSGVVLSCLFAGLAYVMISEKELIPEIKQVQKTPINETKQSETNIIEQKPSIAPIITPQKSIVKTKDILSEKNKTTENQTVEPVSTSASNENPVPKLIEQKSELTKTVAEIQHLNVCEKVNINAFVSSENACIDNQNGRILVSNIKGGELPYQIKVLNEAKEMVSTSNLGSGKYSILISDKLNCTKEIENILIREIDCRKDFELNIGAGETFDLEIASQSATFTVFDKAGNNQFQKEFIKGEKIQWNGYSSQGEALAGYYQFQVKYQNGEIRIGSITITK